MLGTCCAIVMDDIGSMVLAFQNLMQFYAPRVVRAVHAVPRGQRWLDRICSQVRRRQGRRWTSSIASRDRQQHHGQHDLRASATARRCPCSARSERPWRCSCT
jgi:NADH:ubiquinone oxidoreductase subunit F (NADH-binding)